MDSVTEVWSVCFILTIRSWSLTSWLQSSLKNTPKMSDSPREKNSTQLWISMNARCSWCLMCCGHSRRKAWRGDTGKPSTSCPDRWSWERRLCSDTARRGGSDTPCCEGKKRAHKMKKKDVTKGFTHAQCLTWRFHCGSLCGNVNLEALPVINMLYFM